MKGRVAKLAIRSHRQMYAGDSRVRYNAQDTSFQLPATRHNKPSTSSPLFALPSRSFAELFFCPSYRFLFRKIAFSAFAEGLIAPGGGGGERACGSGLGGAAAEEGGGGEAAERRRCGKGATVRWDGMAAGEKGDGDALLRCEGAGVERAELESEEREAETSTVRVTVRVTVLVTVRVTV